MEDLEEASARGGEDLDACQRSANAIAADLSFQAEAAVSQGLHGLLRAQEAQYNGIMNRIERDKRFIEFLSSTIVGLEPAPEGAVD